MDSRFENLFGRAEPISANVNAAVEIQKGKTVDLLLESKSFICATSRGNGGIVSACGNTVELTALLASIIEDLRKGGMNEHFLRAAIAAAMGE